MSKAFKIEPHTSMDKRFVIQGPEITLYVDNDDVDQATVARESKKLVAILNKHWENEE
jgi:hypothetical protein